MCIIVSKEKNKKIPNKGILENCFNSNPDGAGFMYTFNNKVIIEKGFFTFNEFYNRLMQVDKSLNLKKKSLVMHFRIGTSGGYAEGACHPFPITNNIKELQKTETTSKLAMVHNGIISNYTFGKLSDTQNFVKDFVFPLSKINGNFLNNKNAIDLLYKQSAATKLCFLDKNDNITYVGDFITDQGIKYSNTSYKEYAYMPLYQGYGKYKNNKFFNWMPNYDEDYEYDEFTDTYLKAKKKEEYVWLAKDEVKILKKGMAYYDEEFLQLNEIEEDGLYCIDELYSLYEICSKGITDKIKWLKCKLIENNVYIYKSLNDFEELEYSQIN